MGAVVALQKNVDPKNAKAGTVRESLEALERAGLPRDPMLDSVRVPEGFEYLWALFWDIRRGAPAGFSGASVSWDCLADFQAVTGGTLDGFEVDAILAMDAALRAEEA